MNRDEFNRIANEELDGAASREDREALRRHLAVSAEARTQFESLQELVQRLKRVGLEEAPPDLRPSVIRATVAQRRALESVKRSDGWRDFLEGFFRVPDLRGALTFASGVGVGAVAIAIVAGGFVGSRRDQSSGLTGTMAPPNAVAPDRLVATRTLEAGGIRVIADTRRTSDGVVLRLAASGAGVKGASVSATFDRGALRPTSLRMDPPSAGGFEVNGGAVRIGFSGEGTVILAFRAPSVGASPIDLALDAGGGRTVQTRIEAGPSGSR